MDHHHTGIATHEAQTENQKGQPGYEGVLNNRVTTIAEVLQANGYRTFMGRLENRKATSTLWFGQWQLCNLATDPGETVDLAKKEKKKLKTLVAHWEAYAKANDVVEPSRPVSYAKPPE